MKNMLRPNRLLINKIVITTSVQVEDYMKIKEYMTRNRITKAKALREIIKKGLATVIYNDCEYKE